MNYPTLARDKHPEVAAIIDAMKAAEKERNEVVGIVEDIAVVHCYQGAAFPDAPYTSSLCGDGKWRPTRTYYRTAHAAFLGALGEKFDGPNSQFGIYASRMLGINQSAQAQPHSAHETARN